MSQRRRGRTYCGFRSCTKKPGWTAELNEPVQRFISKFERAKHRYSVKLVFKGSLQGRHPSGPVKRTPRSVTPRQCPRRQPRRHRRGPSSVVPRVKGSHLSISAEKLPIIPPENPYLKPRYTPGESTQGPYGTRLSGKRGKSANSGGWVNGQEELRMVMMAEPPQNGGGMLRGREANLTSDGGMVQIIGREEGGLGDEEEGPVGLSDMEEDEDGQDEEDDNLSLCTAVTTQERDLRREGIQVQDLETRAIERLSDFDNSYFWKIKKEMKELRRSDHWTRNLNRAPLACFLLLEMFKGSADID